MRKSIILVLVACLMSTQAHSITTRQFKEFLNTNENEMPANAALAMGYFLGATEGTFFSARECISITREQRENLRKEMPGSGSAMLRFLDYITADIITQSGGNITQEQAESADIASLVGIMVRAACYETLHPEDEQ